MTSKKQFLLEISNLLGSERVFDPRTVMSISKKQLENILTELTSWEKPKNFKIKGEAPRLQSHPSEADNGYRHRMSKYIQNNTGIYVPPSSTVSARFYNAIVIHLDLYQ